MLRGMLAADSENIQALAGLVQTYVESGNLATARTLIAGELARDLIAGGELAHDQRAAAARLPDST